MKKIILWLKSNKNKLIADARVYLRKRGWSFHVFDRFKLFFGNKGWNLQRGLIILGTFILFIGIFTGIYFLIVKPDEGEANWWNPAYRYRKQITIEYSGTEKLTEYQVLVEIDTSDLITAGKLQSDCDDIRFTDQVGVELDYYLVDGCNTTDTKIWVKTSRINPPKVNLFMYYGNGGASAGSDESATFSYSSPKEVAYVLDEDVDDLQFMSLEDGNVIEYNGMSVGLDRYESGEIQGDATGVSAGAYHSCVLKSNGNVDCYGHNGFGQSADYIGGDAEGVSAGGYYTCVLQSNGNVDCYGSNGFGQLADYTGGDAEGVSAGWYHSCVLKSNGNVDCYGRNDSGQSADYTGGDAVGVSAGVYHTCVLQSNGNVDCYGENSEGQSADYTGGDAVGVSAGGYYTCVLKSNGNVDCYGNSFGQSADYTGGDAEGVSAGWKYTCVLQSNGNIDCYGSNTYGQSADYTGGDAVGVSAAVLHTCVLKSNGNVDCYGENSEGQSVDYIGSLDPFSPISATAPFHADDSSDNTDMVVPVSWAGEDFYFYSVNASENLYLYMIAPWGDATVTAYANGSAITGCTSFTVTDSGLAKTCSSVASGSIRVSSDVPILLFTQPTNGDDQMPVKPATDQSWLGGGGTSRIVNGNSTLDWDYIYDTTASNVNPADLSVNGNASISGQSGYGGGASLIWSDNSNYNFGVVQTADGDGSDGHMYNDITEQSTRFGSANQADYISIASTSAATCSLYEQDGTQIGTAQTTTSSNSSVYHAGFGTGDSNTITSGAWYMECDKPVVAYYQKAPSAESNLMHYPMMRQFTYPTPEVTNIESEEMTKEPILHLSFDEGYGSTVYNRAGIQPPRDPVAYWKMDETSGTTVYDETLNNRDGGLTGTVGATGKHGRTINFDGSDDCLVIDDTADNDNIYNPLGSFAISFWMKTDFTSSVDNDNLVFTNREYGSGSNDYLFLGGYWGDGNDMRVYLRDSSGNVQFSEYVNDVADQAWHHVVFVIDREKDKGIVYKDGVKEVEASIDASFNYNGNNWMGVGCEYYTSRRFFYDGSVDDLKIYDYAPAEGQIQNEYQQTNGMMMNMDESDWVQGVNGTALDFDGSNTEYVSMPKVFIIPESGTLSTWIKGDANSQISHNIYPFGFEFFSILGPSSDGSDNRAGLIVQNSGSNYNYDWGGQTVFDDNWHHYAVTWDDTNVYLYVDGKQVGSPKPHSGNIPVGETRRALAGSSWSVSYGAFTGLLDESKVYPYARNSSEIKADFNSYKNKVGTSVGHGGRQPSQSNTDKPVLWYDFNDGTGTSVYDRSGNGNYGLMMNMDEREDYVAGKYGKALDFDGSDDYIDMDTFSSTSGSYTFNMWVNSSRADETLDYLFDSESGRFVLGFFTNTSGQIGFFDGSWKNFGSAPNDGKWHHLSFVFDGSNSTAELYVDGVQFGSSQSYSSKNIGGNIALGTYHSGGSSTYKGQIDEVKIYDYARTPAEIHEDMNGSPLAYWKFDEGYGTTVNDSMGNYNKTQTGLDWNDSGRYGKTLQYSGISGEGVDLMDHADLTNIQSNSNSFSYSLWFKSDKTTGGDSVARIISRDCSNYFCIQLDQAGTYSNQVRMYYSASENSGFKALNGTTDWHHTVGVWDQENSKFYWYLDGKLIYEDTTLTDFTTATRDIFLGANSEGGGLGGNNFSGYIDDVKIYNYALTEDQVKAEYNAPYGNPSFDGTSVRYGVGDTDELGFTMPDPIAHWNFDEGSGTSLQDVSGNGNTGTLTNMDASTDWVPGKYGKALDFDGSDDWVDLGSLGSYTAGTISFWFKKENINVGAQYLFDGRGTGNWYLLQDYSASNCSDTAGNICFNNQVEIPSSNLSNDIWYHVAITANSSETKIYLDGVLIDVGSALTPNFNSVRIGTRYTNSSYLDGQIDETKIYDQALTPAQVAWEYNKGKPIFHMKMDQDELFDCNGGESGTANVCESNSGLHGTANGGMTDSNFVDGKFGNALDFDGTDDYINIGNNTALDFTSEDFSVSMWINPSTNDSNNRLFCRGMHNSEGYDAFLDAGNLYFSTYQSGSNSRFNTTGAPVNTGDWNHVEFIKEGNNGYIYINGVEVASSSTFLDPIISTNDFYLARYQSTGYEYNGQIDDVRIYNYARTPEQVKLDYNNGAAVKFE